MENIAVAVFTVAVFGWVAHLVWSTSKWCPKCGAWARIFYDDWYGEIFSCYKCGLDYAERDFLTRKEDRKIYEN